VIPLGKANPGPGPLLVGAKLPQLSVAVGSVQVTTAVQRLGSVFVTTLLGHINWGDWLSNTFTAKLQEIELPEISTTE